MVLCGNYMVWHLLYEWPFLLFVDLSDGMTTSPYYESIINVALYKGGVQCSQGRFGKNLFNFIHDIICSGKF